MTRAAFLSLSMVLLTACETPPPTAMSRPDARTVNQLDASGGPSASGAVRILFGRTFERYSFHAVMLPDGTARGEAEFHDVTAGVSGHIDINCLNVVGNTATLSGIVTRTSDPTLEGFQGIFQVVDNGEGAKSPPDFASLINFYAVGTGVDCTVPAEYDLVPIEEGNVQVEP